ncbi:hypothetical protein B0J15DRAFT_462415 [Fusarium solani]|uniref:Uncharacterized protein n=1 Tax=Fusarium solani TaxID=169388 RepID=A0A9P9KTS8_FUSSL|nr:uncharacterized protein B0J15DRAFT_462415 [Fusarium solani]KAH7268397.1 hypothetical protein B0J15DRAFT_462415 [Fusarium solani]
MTYKHRQTSLLVIGCSPSTTITAPSAVTASPVASNGTTAATPASPRKAAEFKRSWGNPSTSTRTIAEDAPSTSLATRIFWIDDLERDRVERASSLEQCDDTESDSLVPENANFHRPTNRLNLAS